MLIKEIEDKEKYNDYIKNQHHSQFLQSHAWGEFLKTQGKKVKRFCFFDNDKLFFALSLYKSNLPFGFCYYSAPRIGIKFLSEEQVGFVFQELRKIFKKKKVLFLRVEPRTKLIINNEKLIIKKTIDVQPSKTIILDLTKSEEELLQAMHQKTRYNIRLAKKKGVIVRVGEDDDFEKFWALIETTGGRDGFRLHGKEHYKNMLGINNEDLKIKLYLAEFEGKVIAANIISFFGDMVTYVHGASSNEFRNVMAPFMLQWEVIKIAKENGFKSYDFYGIDEEKWPGVTRFKKGFRGEFFEYPGTFDLIFNKCLYIAYKAIRKIRRLF